MKTGQDVAKYIDIELNGYALVAVVENAMTQKIFNNEGETIYLQGRLRKIENTSMQEGLDRIKEAYLEDLGTEMSKEEILNMFTPLQLVSFKEEKPNIFLVMFLIIALIGIGLACGILIKITIQNQKQYKKKEKKGENSFKNV